MQRIVTIAQCTNRKRASAGTVVSADEIGQSSVGGFARSWAKLLEETPSRQSISELYCGRGFSEYRTALDSLASVEAYIISAGLGLASFSDTAPNYNFTASATAKQSPLRKLGIAAETWWEHINLVRLNDPSPLSTLLKSGKWDLGLVCVSKSYIPLICSDFENISPISLSKVRLIGPIGRSGLTSKMRQVLMPYNHNLDGPDSPNSGTKSDFSQRALRHFVEHILVGDPRATVKEHAQLVAQSMAKLRAPTLNFDRKRLSDSEVTGLIERYWDICEGKSGDTLRYLRDHGFACEQTRFTKLFRNYKHKRLCDHV